MSKECKGLPPSHIRNIELAKGTYGLKMWKSSPSMTQSGEVMNKISTLTANGNSENIPTVIGIDLAKNVFSLHAVNRHRKPALVKPQVRRDQLLEVLAHCHTASLAWGRAQAPIGVKVSLQFLSELWSHLHNVSIKPRRRHRLEWLVSATRKKPASCQTTANECTSAHPDKNGAKPFGS
jgi:hypothetical protein